MYRTSFLLLLAMCLLTRQTALAVTIVYDTSHPATQMKTIQILTNHVSSFLTQDQYLNITDTLAAQLYAGMTFEEIKAGAMTMAMGVLTSAQYSQAIAKATSLIFVLGASGIQAALSTLMTVISNNCTPFFNQLVEYVGTLRTQGMKQKGITKNGYRIVNSFASSQRIKTIFTRVSLQFSASQWKSLVSSLEGLIQFKKNGFS
ncbi:hypothetical protein M3Y97_01070500 [Aphelenchoides bicaudatus]|nr:hypothetical protein M3Y97_01070500 [Aphelenchoides bicaudatus]